ARANRKAVEFRDRLQHTANRTMLFFNHAAPTPVCFARRSARAALIDPFGYFGFASAGAPSGGLAAFFGAELASTGGGSAGGATFLPPDISCTSLRVAFVATS